MPATDETTVAVSRIEPEKYSWHDSQWLTLTRNINRLPHALLLHGQVGLGKDAFALRLAQFMLCLDRPENQQACGKCRSCALFRVGNHPDLLRIGLLDDGKSILVDQIREVIEFLSLKAHTAAYKVVVVSPAQAMNVSAANSLLKILEEPPAGSLLILTTTHLSRVPVTIRSRCMQVAFIAPPLSEALEWMRSQKIKTQDPETLLTRVHGAPLATRALTEEGAESDQTQWLADLALLASRKTDPVTCAERWKSNGTERGLEWLQWFVATTIRSQAPLLTHGEITLSLDKSNTFTIFFIDLFEFLDKISILKKQLGTGIDETLLLEDILIRWCEITTRAV